MINLPDLASRHREWLAKTRLQTGFARALAPRLRQEFERVADSAASGYEAGEGIEAALAHHPERIATTLAPSLVATATAFAQRARKMFKKSVIVANETKDSEDQMRDRIARFVRGRARTSMARVANTTKTRINRTIARGVEHGDSPKKIADAIRLSTGGKVGAARAKIIAQTEVHSAANAGELESVKSFDLPVRKEWVSMGDELVRDDHQAVNGDEVGLDDDFDVGDDQLSYPGDPDAPPAQTVNCRCMMVYNEDKKS